MSDTESASASAWTVGRIVGLILAALAVVFIFQNTQPVAMQVLLWPVEPPLWVATAALLVIGFLVGTVVTKRRAKRK